MVSPTRNESSCGVFANFKSNMVIVLDFRDVTLQAIVDFSTQLDAALDGLTPEEWR